MAAVYLHGGGGHAPSFEPFIQAVSDGGNIAVILVGDDVNPADYTALLESAGAHPAALHPICIPTGGTLRAADLQAAQPSGVLVGGGETPAYQAALCHDTAWLDYVRERNIPFSGTSAGAAIAAARAVVGGWRIQAGDRQRQILFQGASEGLDLLDVRPGLDLIPFSVEVHASQFGTLTRLLHAVNLGLTADGWAIDENTMLIVNGPHLRVSGLGQVYHVRRGGQIEVTIYGDGAVISA